MYRVKHFKSTDGCRLQKEIKSWIESRNHIQIISVNTWTLKEIGYCTIVYREVQYIG